MFKKLPPNFVIIRKETKEENEAKSNNNEAKTSKAEATPPKLENKKKGPLSVFLGKRITIQAVKSSVLYEGEFIDYIDGFLILKNAKILGTKHNAEVDTLVINRNQIAHIHSELKSIEEKNS